MQENGRKNRPQNENYAMNLELFIVIWQENWCANINVTMIFKKCHFCWTTLKDLSNSSIFIVPLFDFICLIWVKLCKCSRCSKCLLTFTKMIEMLSILVMKWPLLWQHGVHSVSSCFFFAVNNFKHWFYIK